MKAFAESVPEKVVRLRLTIRGAVQGVGFRPFVYRLANELGLAGWVNNSPQGVCVEIEGMRVALEMFRRRLDAEKPVHSAIHSCEAAWLDALGCDGFFIRDSECNGDKTAIVLPDIATCPHCLSEIFDPANRRYRYPFTNCTNCGPRFSIIESLSYDRANTSMKTFKMCPRCQAEYDDPRDRRFHAQPNACPNCGPHLEFWDGEGEAIVLNDYALSAAAEALRDGSIVAVKSLGGFHLMVDARNDEAVQRLRERKHRDEKAFALLFPSLQSVAEHCETSALERELLCSPAAPIVLLRRRQSQISNCRFQIAESVAPRNPNLGVMLSSNPLQHLLMAELGFPVVATSGNLSDEPICTDEHEALARLRGIADFFLVHNRPIVRHVDDSIVRVVLGREMILRRARGFAPLPVEVRNTAGGMQNILAVGAHLKNSVALAIGKQVFISQHIGELETEQANEALRRTAADLSRLYDAKPQVVVADLHPDYASTQFALAQKAKVVRVQHHVAHALSCIAENEVELPALAVVWDGTGCGDDGTIWGGEFFCVTDESIERVAHFRAFRLPGGDAAVKEPRRTALGVLREVLGDDFFRRSDIPSVAAFTSSELLALRVMLSRDLNSPQCTSAGRLVDAVASLTGLRQRMSFGGQAAMELEFAAREGDCDSVYSFPLRTATTPFVLDWLPLIQEVIADLERETAIETIAAKFHNALAEAIVAVAKTVGEPRVVLNGGCFQNAVLVEGAATRLRRANFEPYWHQRIPPNDGGIALGQIVAARRQLHPVAADASLLRSKLKGIRADSRRLVQTER